MSHGTETNVVLSMQFYKLGVKYMFISLNKIYKTPKKIYLKKMEMIICYMFKEKGECGPDTFYFNPHQILLHAKQYGLFIPHKH